MIELKLALELAALEQTPEAALQTAARLGVQGVEIDARGDFSPTRLSQTGVRQFRKMLDDARMRVAAVRFRTRRSYYDPAELDARVEATKRAMRLAYSVGAGVVVNRVGRVPPQDSAEWTLLREVLNDLGRHGHRIGVLLAAEAAEDSPADLARLLEALEPGALGLALDPGRLVLAGHAPQEAVEALGGGIVHVHVSDARRDTPWGSGRTVALGEGSVDFPALLGALEARDYRGWLTIRAPEDANPRDAIAQGIEFLRRL